MNAGFLDDGQLLLSDGALILIQNDYDSNTSAKMITIDVNGYQKDRMHGDMIYLRLKLLKTG